MNNIEIKDELFFRLAIEVLEKKRDISNFTDEDGNIILIKTMDKAYYWIVSGIIEETNDGNLNFQKSGSTFIGRHFQTLKCKFLSKCDILQLIGKTTINDFAEELRELYLEHTGHDWKNEERMEKRSLLLRYFMEIKDEYMKLEMKDGENYLSYAERIGRDCANRYVKTYYEILDKTMKTIGELAAMYVLTDDENERRIYERTIDRIVAEALNRMP